jgi:hypothetical protein
MEDTKFSDIGGTRKGWIEAAAMHHRNEQYYRGLVIQIGQMFGREAQIADDGTDMQEVLCAKVPELVEAALRSVRAAQNELGVPGPDYPAPVANAVEHLRSIPRAE